MMATNFKEWLLDAEFKRLVEAVVYRRPLTEADRSLDAAMQQNNFLFTQHLGGVRKNWFGIILGQAKNYGKGGDILTIASEAASELLMSLDKKDPADPFFHGVQQILALEDPGQKENQLAAFFTNAAMLRVRRFGGQYHRKKDQITKPFSALDKRGADSMSAIEAIPDEREPDDAEQRMNALRRGIMLQLDRMIAQGGDKRTVARLELAKRVAERRMENPPNFPSLEELMDMFPEVGKTTMFKILQDIQDAATAAAGSMGIDTANIARKRKPA